MSLSCEHADELNFDTYADEKQRRFVPESFSVIIESFISRFITQAEMVDACKQTTNLPLKYVIKHCDTELGEDRVIILCSAICTNTKIGVKSFSTTINHCCLLSD